MEKYAPIPSCTISERRFGLSYEGDLLKGTIMNNILVGNLLPNVSEQNIRSLFEKYGAVKRFKLMRDQFTGLSRGFGFIEMKTDAKAEDAIAALNGTDLNGKVALSDNPTDGPF
jgi:RNA recognition motif-containing protein